MFLIVNGKPHPLPEPLMLTELLHSLSPMAPFAVAHNEEFVPRGAYDTCRISPGDRIDIVFPTAGG
ncbi:MAG TPA: sulfur carrier protein ThiS [Candidatus Acidoferrales bacterium]|nr:sulfur carrier protein ThiS [Candidatus Acidoferrales bacterium]